MAHESHTCNLEVFELFSGDSELDFGLTGFYGVGIAAFGESGAYEVIDERPARIVDHGLYAPVVMSFDIGEGLIYCESESEDGRSCSALELFTGDSGAYAPACFEVFVEVISECAYCHCGYCYCCSCD